MLFLSLKEIQVLSAFFSFFYNILSILISNICTTTLSIFYQTITSTQDFVMIIGNESIIQLLPGCTGFNQVLRITFILLLYPISFRKKIFLLPLSWILIIFAAVIHFLMLIPIASDINQWYDFVHNWFSRFVFYAFFFINWLFWEKLILSKENPINSRI